MIPLIPPTVVSAEQASPPETISLGVEEGLLSCDEYLRQGK